jgi:PhzF family phenazine biosynthesis protein
MGQSIIQVDAFTATPFQGNPAAVCILPAPKDPQWMQQVAREMNLSETAFVIPGDRGFDLRWFTPTTEVPLCGHATLASAHALWTEGYLTSEKPAEFHTKSGVLTARRQADWIELDFPANPSVIDVTMPVGLEDAIGASVQTLARNSLGVLVEVGSQSVVEQLHPNFSQLLDLGIATVTVTSLSNAGAGYDFVSRFFAPGIGIQEDPVTGAAHCCLAPYWFDRLQKNQMLGYQASERGGWVKVMYDGGDRVLLSGQAITVMRGELLHS